MAVAHPRTSMSADIRWAVAVGLLTLLAALAGIDARATYGARTTADEPQYLLTAISLAEDGSLDIADEIADERYRSFHEIGLDRQTSVLADGREVSPHDPLLPLLLAVPTAVGGWAAAKATLALLAAVTAAATVLVATRRWHVAPAVAGVVVSAAFVGLPLAGYGTQVYPELPAALAALAGFAAVTATRRTRTHLVLAVAAIVALPWLAVKYVPVAGVLAVALLGREPAWRRRNALAAALGSAGVLYLAAHRAWYGGWTVYATGDHFESDGEFAVVGTQVDLLGRSRRLVGLLVDRDFGLAAWSPVWLLLPVAAAVIARRRPDGWATWIAVVAAGWLNATFVALTMHGWWVPGRQVVVILPIAAIGIAWYVDRTRRLVAPVLIAVAIAASSWVWLAVEASTGRRTLVVDFMATTAPGHRIVRPLLPSGLRDGPIDQLLLAAWTVLLATACVVAVRADRDAGLDTAGSDGVRPTATRSPTPAG